MTFLVENWFVLVGISCCFLFVGFMVFSFLKLPQKEQIAKVKEWLLLACAEAERELGDGTGKLKLRWVYDLFLQRFPAIAMAVSFETFSLWVDSALEEMRRVLTQNQAVKAFVKGEKM